MRWRMKKGVGPDSVEEIFDMEFRRRFSELINQTARRNSTNVYNWPPVRSLVTLK